MARKKQSGFEDLVDVVALLPWWAGVGLAIFSYFILHDIATQEVIIKSGTPDFTIQFSSQLFKTLASFGQYILPMAFIVGSIGSLLRRKQRGDLFKSASSRNSKNEIQSMRWHEFELLVGEAFRQQGFSVAETGSGADGGVDLIANKNNRKYFIQCKHWKKSKVGVSIVRELLGVIASEKADGGYVVISGVFTAEAKDFAAKNNIKLLDGKTLSSFIKQQQIAPASNQNVSTTPVNQSVITDTPACPVCGQNMVKRIAKQGPNIGNNFWGCSQYPKCRGIVSV